MQLPEQSCPKPCISLPHRGAWKSMNRWADVRCQNMKWLCGHHINVHVTTLRFSKSFSFLEKWLYKCTVTVHSFSFPWCFIFLLLGSLRCLSVACSGSSVLEVSNIHSLQKDVPVENVWEFRLTLYTVGRMQEAVSSLCYIWLLLFVHLLLSCTQCDWIRCT